MSESSEAVRLLWPAIRQAANSRVGHKRTDAADIARILWEHGARSAAGLNAVEKHIFRPSV